MVFLTTTELKPHNKMEIWTHHNYHFLLLSRGPSWLLGSVRFLSPCMCSQFRLRNVFRFEFSMGSRSSSVSPLMTTHKGRSTTVSEELCKVFWIVEADLEACQLLYLSGDLVALGCWQPGLSILMHRCEQSKLWKAEVEIPAGVHFKYNYFIKDMNCPSCDVIWRPGPEFSLVVPSNSKQSRDLMVRDSWVKFDPERPPAHFGGSWIEEMYPSKQLSLTSPGRGTSALLEALNVELPPSNMFSEHSNGSSVLTDEDINHLNLAIKKPKLFQKDLKINGNRCFDGETVAANHSDPVSVLSERDQPIEEPWFLQRSIISLAKKEEIIMNLSDIKDEVDEGLISLDENRRYSKDKDALLPADGNTLSLKGDSVSTEILINSSLCTMQRIAVLENGKLVELLLEPVNTDVQCDSVYLGMVTKFVPHMGGAFVNIGASRPSLMDIKQNREPFILPPFRKRKDKGVLNSVLQILEENSATAETEQASNDVDDVDVTSQTNLVVPLIHDDDEELEVDDDFETSEIKENVNGSTVNHSGGSADFENFLNGIEHHMGDKSADNSLGLETEGCHDASLSQDTTTKDAKHSSLNERKWDQVQKGTKIIVQVVKEGLGTKGPTLTAYPKLRSRFWILSIRCDRIGVSKKISGVERIRLKVIAKTLQPQGFGLTVRTVAAGHSLEELQKDLEGLLSTWKNITEHAKSAALAADEGVEGAVPLILHTAMGQTLSVVQDYFNEKVKRMVVDSARTYHEVTNYLQDIAPDLCNRVELYDKRIPLFDEFNIEDEIDNLLSKRVSLANGGSLVIEQTEALVSIDVNGGHVMFGQGTSQEKAILDVNLSAAKQIARELRLRDIGGIIVVDFIDMADDSNKRLVYEEMKREVERDRSTLKVSELSKHGLMEITRKRVRPSVTFMISEPCTCCHATGRVEALETSFSKIEQEICRLLAKMKRKAVPENPKTWPRFILRVDHHMCEYLTSGKRTRLAILSSSLKVWILLKVARGFTRGAFEVKLFTDEQANNHEQQVAISLLPRAETRSTKSSSKKLTLVPIKKGKSKGK